MKTTTSSIIPFAIICIIVVVGLAAAVFESTKECLHVLVQYRYPKQGVFKQVLSELSNRVGGQQQQQQKTPDQMENAITEALDQLAESKIEADAIRLAINSKFFVENMAIHQNVPSVDPCKLERLLKVDHLTVYNKLAPVFLVFGETLGCSGETIKKLKRRRAIFLFKRVFFEELRFWLNIGYDDAFKGFIPFLKYSLKSCKNDFNAHLRTKFGAHKQNVGQQQSGTTTSNNNNKNALSVY